MIGLDFTVQAPVVAPAPNRADIACFVGFVRRRATALPAPVQRWLREQGWMTPPSQRDYQSEVEPLLNLPVPIDTWEVFDHLFAWEQRDLTPGGAQIATYLGAAVRSFFAQGGRKCYVVRVGDPWPLFDPRLAPRVRQAMRLRNVRRLIPGFTLLADDDVPTLPPEADEAQLARLVSPVERSTWRSLDHLFGLPEVSFVCLPDLADAVRTEPAELPAPELPVAPERFVECTQPTPLRQDGVARYVSAPRCDERGYLNWSRAVHQAGSLIARFWREIQLVAAVPRPDPSLRAERDLLRYLNESEAQPLEQSLNAGAGGAASAFVQLAYPWPRTPGSWNLPERLESPDGVLTGLLARNALTRGTFRSAAQLSLGDVYDLEPILSRDQFTAPHPRRTLLERVSLLGPTPSGWRLLSDVTTCLNEAYRPAAVNRLVSALVRAARRMGEESVFEPSGEALWRQLRNRFTGMLTDFYLAGALRGAAPNEAFEVRCDRTTMTQSDIDNGRLIARIVFDPALPIERITVVLAMEEGGQISLLSDNNR